MIEIQEKSSTIENSKSSSIISSDEDQEEERSKKRRSAIINRFKKAVYLVIKWNKAKKHGNGNCFTNYFFCHFNSLFKTNEIKERGLRPLPEAFTSKKIMKRFDTLYKELEEKNLKEKSKKEKKFTVAVSGIFAKTIRKEELEEGQVDLTTLLIFRQLSISHQWQEEKEI